MSYELETISPAEWENIKKQPEMQKHAGVSNVPIERAINHANGNFLIQVGVDSHRDEWQRRCVLVGYSRSLLVRFGNMSNTSGGKLSVSWRPWNGILEAEISPMNLELAEAFKSLYKLQDGQFVVEVVDNPYYVMPKDELIERFNSMVNIWFSRREYEAINRQIARLNAGKKSIFKWKFYLAKWQGVPQCKVTDDLINWVAGLTANPKYLDVLLQHLDDGGERFSENTKGTLAYIRNRKPA